MFQKFFTNTLTSNFIKALVYNTHIPTLQSVLTGDFIIKDVEYAYGNSIIRCSKSGIIGDTAQYSFISNFFDNKYSYGKYVSRNSYYDSDTHKHLGDYLRYIKAVNGIDLMPFYNCFNYKVLENVAFLKDTSNERFSTVEDTSNNYKMIAVPILFNKVYTVAIDCMTEVIVKPVFLSKFGLLQQDEIQNMLNGVSSGFIKYSTSYRRPFKFCVDISTLSDNDMKTLYEYQKCLYVLIQLPSSNTSSITVIEGDYTNNVSDNVIDVPSLKNLSSNELNTLFISDLSLLMINDGNIYAFSDRLIEYLLGNVIDSSDAIYNNIDYVQRELGVDRTGEWSNLLRYKLFNSVMKNKNLKDINGFVDRYTENQLAQNHIKGGNI